MADFIHNLPETIFSLISGAPLLILDLIQTHVESGHPVKVLFSKYFRV